VNALCAGCLVGICDHEGTSPMAGQQARGHDIPAITYVNGTAFCRACVLGHRYAYVTWKAG
jgi:hypothetical protein